MDIKPIEDAKYNFDIVYTHTTNIDNITTPHCLNHGAMSKLNETQWICTGLNCNAGCEEVITTN